MKALPFSSLPRDGSLILRARDTPELRARRLLAIRRPSVAARVQGLEGCGGRGAREDARAGPWVPLPSAGGELRRSGRPRQRVGGETRATTL